ncbi:hypothetical protein MIZ01_1104 [Sideroxyarcus emersonii]|uniref:DUF3240 domain-containing protein n=1 Tax=Sideroxyarcus emersonii TaxID=2764705 RepID=A0AAN1XA19_9PROT|nr:DUF3240 family protein [Sideroxyarcus emersonii]BCK87332.1 hypothetical protein MIZ01_1104 [Sideroxyarcus emersonii]
MREMNCCLTLVSHRTMEERLVSHLLEHPEWVHGFVMHQAEGGSQKEKLPSMIEQVRGRSQRVVFQAVMDLADARALVAHLKQIESNPEIAYWITPVIEFGRLE